MGDLTNLLLYFCMLLVGWAIMLIAVFVSTFVVSGALLRGVYNECRQKVNTVSTGTISDFWDVPTVSNEQKAKWYHKEVQVLNSEVPFAVSFFCPSKIK